jgi:hypothetical protein
VTTVIYRSVKLVVQNSTNESLSLQGVAILKGRWADKMEPVQGGLVREQSAAEWMSISTDLGTGTSGFFRLGSSHGYAMVRWHLPWTGKFDWHIEEVPGLSFHAIPDESQPDAVILLIAVREHHEHRASHAEARAK